MRADTIEQLSLSPNTVPWRQNWRTYLKLFFLKINALVTRNHVKLQCSRIVFLNATFVHLGQLQATEQSYLLCQKLAPEKAAEHRQRHSGEGVLLRLGQGQQWWCSSPLPGEWELFCSNKAEETQLHPCSGWESNPRDKTVTQWLQLMRIQILNWLTLQLIFVNSKLERDWQNIT